MALLNAARPPSSGIFSRWTMTTRLCGETESALRQFHRTVQPSGTMIRASPARKPLIRAEGAPGGAVTSRVRVAVRAALSTVSHDGELSAVAAGADDGGGAGVGADCDVGAAGEPWP